MAERHQRDDTKPLDEALAMHAVFEADEGPGVMIDVGAHMGGSAIPFLRKRWRVYAIEPDASKHGALHEINHNGDLTLIASAVSDEPREGAAFFTSAQSTGIASLVPFHESHEQAAAVRVTTLANIIAEQAITRVDYLKIDAEGADLPVLRGFPFDRLLPRAIMCEFEDAKTKHLDYQTHDLGRFLLDRGYTVWMSEWAPVVRYGMQHTWRSVRPYPCELRDPKGWGNFLAARPGPDADRLEHSLQPKLAADD